MAKIQILLASYNGERFLQAQLDSLIAQTNQDWELLIRDDNSTDNTPKIIEAFAKAHPDKVRVIRDEPTHRRLGHAQNFSQLLDLSTAPYVMFCDQDDVWHPDKIEVMLGEMQKMEKLHGKHKPLLVYSDVSLCDAELTVKAPSEGRYSKRYLENHKPGRMLLENPILGMAMILNRPLVAKCSVPEQNNLGHDAWVTKVAAVTGHLGYIDRPLVDYRVHSGNTSSIHIKGDIRDPRQVLKKRPDENFFGYAERRIHHINTLNNERLKQASEGAKELLLRFGDEIDDDTKRLLTCCARLPSMSRAEQVDAMVQEELLPASLRHKTRSLLLAGNWLDENSPKK